MGNRIGSVFVVVLLSLAIQACAMMGQYMRSDKPIPEGHGAMVGRVLVKVATPDGQASRGFLGEGTPNDFTCGSVFVPLKGGKLSSVAHIYAGRKSRSDLYSRPKLPDEEADKKLGGKMYMATKVRGFMVADLPTGTYHLGDLSLEGAPVTLSGPTTAFKMAFRSKEFTIEAGRTTYIGDIHITLKSEKLTNEMDKDDFCQLDDVLPENPEAPGTFAFEVADNSSTLKEELGQLFPHLDLSKDGLRVQLVQ